MPDNLPIANAGEDNNIEIWFIYILYCHDDSLYTGITRNIVKRIHQHNHCKSGSKYTRSRRPVELVYYEEVKGKSDAAKREHQIKKLTPVEKRRLIASCFNNKEVSRSQGINNILVGKIINQLNNGAEVSPQIPRP